MIELEPMSCFQRYTLPVQTQLQIPRVTILCIDESIGWYNVTQRGGVNIRDNNRCWYSNRFSHRSRRNLFRLDGKKNNILKYIA
ncbi:hypothetical protein PUN28_013354 [Cardiocondyla obscurior]|uniref:Uncharacterized protein n=1 Tax=Cardiocondyla obscurior TaxID=286306 RepID=A0AAW2FAS0_9HYME